MAVPPPLPPRAPRPPGPPHPPGGPPPPPVPSTPFGPGDNAVPDVSAITDAAAKIRLGLQATQLTLTGMRYGPGPDNTPPPVRDVTRADGLWPYLLIRAFPGDIGQRPLQPDDIPPGYESLALSPDILITPAGAPGPPVVIDRDGIAAVAEQGLAQLALNTAYDVWVHVWNLGRFQATGVRVRVRGRYGPLFLQGPGDPQPTVRFLGGIKLDLGDRLSGTAHRLAKAATFTTGDEGYELIIATAECLTDVANGDLELGADRHSAHRFLKTGG